MDDNNYKFVIDITDDYKISKTDKYNWSVLKRFNKRESRGRNSNVIEGEYRWMPISYHMKPGDAAVNIVLDCQDEEKNMELKEFKQWFDEKCDEIENKVNEKLDT